MRFLLYRLFPRLAARRLCTELDHFLDQVPLF